MEGVLPGDASSVRSFPLTVEWEGGPGGFLPFHLYLGISVHKKCKCNMLTLASLTDMCVQSKQKVVRVTEREEVLGRLQVRLQAWAN